MGEELAPKPHCTAEITQNLSVLISTASHFSIYRQPTTTLGTAAPTYKPHSRNVRAAPRFSPTRFIPLPPSRRFLWNLITSKL